MSRFAFQTRSCAVGAVAAREDLGDPLELALAPELARVRLEVAQRAADELRDRDAVARGR